MSNDHPCREQEPCETCDELIINNSEKIKEAAFKKEVLWELYNLAITMNTYFQVTSTGGINLAGYNSGTNIEKAAEILRKKRDSEIENLEKRLSKLKSKMP